MSRLEKPASEPDFNYSTGVLLAARHAASLLLYYLGLVRDGSLDKDFRSAILRFNLQQADKLTFAFPRQKEGSPYLGSPGRNGKLDEGMSLFTEHLYLDTVNMPPEKILPKNIKYQNKMQHHFNRMRQWWDNFEFEELLTKMAGFRGSAEYCVFKEKQADIDVADMASSLSMPENLPPLWKGAESGLSLTKPTRLLNGWTEPNDTPQDFDFSHPHVWGKGDPFEWLYQFNSWLGGQGDVSSGMNSISPARLMPLDDE